jgi:hypothetical protein
MRMTEKQSKSGFWRGLYKGTSLSFMAVFGVVGLIFLFIPEKVLAFFNRISLPLGFMESPVHGIGFYLILAVGYMYLVAVIAWLMFKHPENDSYPLLLIHGKTASSVLSLAFFIFHGPFLIYLANGVVDGSIALVIFLLFRKVRRETG